MQHYLEKGIPIPSVDDFSLVSPIFTFGSGFGGFSSSVTEGALKRSLTDFLFGAGVGDAASVVDKTPVEIIH